MSKLTHAEKQIDHSVTVPDFKHGRTQDIQRSRRTPEHMAGRGRVIASENHSREYLRDLTERCGMLLASIKRATQALIDEGHVRVGRMKIRETRGNYDINRFSKDREKDDYKLVLEIWISQEQAEELEAAGAIPAQRSGVEFSPGQITKQILGDISASAAQPAQPAHEASKAYKRPNVYLSEDLLSATLEPPAHANCRSVGTLEDLIAMTREEMERGGYLGEYVERIKRKTPFGVSTEDMVKPRYCPSCHHGIGHDVVTHCGPAGEVLLRMTKCKHCQHIRIDIINEESR